MSAGRFDYDHAIVGAGVSGLTLAHRLAEAQPDARILLVDKDDDPDYNISFWHRGEPPFPELMTQRWQRIQVRHGERQTNCDLDRYALYAFWRDDFDAHLAQLLEDRPNIRRLEARVEQVDSRPDHAMLWTDAGPFSASWAYDSRASLQSIQDDDPDLMLMQGLAVEIETEADAFDSQVATLFDFLLDSPQFDFMYVLPMSKRRALVNAAFVTPFQTRVGQEHCEAVIRDYIGKRLGVPQAGFRIVKDCFGRLPLASRFPEREAGSRVLPIGVKAGMIKASTSYAFTRILADAESITDSLVRTGQPYYRDRTPWYYRAADQHTSQIFHAVPELAQELMFRMFQPGQGDLALAFLDEQNSLEDNRQLFEAVPPETLKRFLGQLVMEAIDALVPG